MLTLLNVLKRPTEPHHRWWAAWGPSYLMRFGAMRKKYLTVPHRWVLMTDFRTTAMPETFNHFGLEQPELLPLTQGPTGWWAKLEMFARDFGGPVLYSDLDNVFRPGIDALASLDPETFTVLNSRGQPPVDNSGLMLFQGDGRYRYLWDDYFAHRDDIEREYSVWPHASDQAWISERTGIEGDGPLAFFQDLIPGSTYSPRYEFGRHEYGWRNAACIVGSYGWKPHQHLDKEMFAEWATSVKALA